MPSRDHRGRFAARKPGAGRSGRGLGARAASLTKRLRWIRDELDLDGIVAELNPSGLFSMERMQRTLRILTHEVMPALEGP